MASGGPRTPSKPAPVSGPGRLSQRTDGGPGGKLVVGPGMEYGERQATLAQERTAPMATTDPVQQLNIPTSPSNPPTAAAATASAPQAAAGGPFVFGGPTQRPNEPVTHGVDIGPGGGSEVLPQPIQQAQNPQGPMTQMLGQMGGLTGQLAAVYSAASSRGV